MSRTDQAVSSVIPGPTDDQDRGGAPGHGRGGIGLEAGSEGRQKGSGRPRATLARCPRHSAVPRPLTLAMAVAQLSPASSISWSTLNWYSLNSSSSTAWASSWLRTLTASVPAPCARPVPAPAPERARPSLAYLRYFTAGLAMPAGSPGPPECGRHVPHHAGPVRQAPAWPGTRRRCEPAASTPSPSSARSADMELAPRMCGARPAPEGGAAGLSRPFASVRTPGRTFQGAGSLAAGRLAQVPALALPR